MLNNGSLHKIRDPEKYDLIIVDEAHKFRNDTADGYDLLQKLCKTRTRLRLPDGEFAKKRVILISWCTLRGGTGKCISAMWRVATITTSPCTPLFKLEPDYRHNISLPANRGSARSLRNRV